MNIKKVKTAKKVGKFILRTDNHRNLIGFEYEKDLSEDIKNKLAPEYCSIPEYQTEHIEHPHKKTSCTKDTYTRPSENYSCGYDSKIQNKNEISKIDVVIVSVDYNDFLALTLKSTTSILKS